MKSTGEAIGYDESLKRAFYKALKASGVRVCDHGTVIVTVADEDKQEVLPLVRRFYRLGFNIEATVGTAERAASENGIRTHTLGKLSEGSEEILDSASAPAASATSSTPGRSSPASTTRTATPSAAARWRTASRCSPRSTPCACCSAPSRRRPSPYRRSARAGRISPPRSLSAKSKTDNINIKKEMPKFLNHRNFGISGAEGEI
jgi:hypothetical protein